MASSAPPAVQLQLEALLGDRQVGDVVQAPCVVAQQHCQVHAAACTRAGTHDALVMMSKHGIQLIGRSRPQVYARLSCEARSVAALPPLEKHL